MSDNNKESTSEIIANKMIDALKEDLKKKGKTEIEINEYIEAFLG